MQSEDRTALSDRERAIVEQVAAQRGVTVEEAIEQMAREGLAQRVKRKTGRMPAKVYSMPTRRFA